ncbi:TPA: TonB family protein [Klebsiella quasipneumoniae subsp. similipneumoniae]|nr:TonB family protein [Klebsiella quasipneumoniae subsp. similipneumoniae]
MKAIRLFTLILPLFLALCAGTQVSASTPSGSISSANTSITTGNLLPSFLRLQYDVDSDGRVQNVKILESTTTPELEHQIIDKIMKKWRFEKGKPGKAQRLVVKIQPKSDVGPANKQ